MRLGDGLTRQEVSAYNLARAAAAMTDVAWEAFAAEWGPRLRKHGLGLDGWPLPPDDDLVAGETGQGPGAAVSGQERPPERPPAGQGRRAMSPEPWAVDVLEFIAGGEDDDEEEWLVRGIIPKHGLTILGGNPKNGKTLFALDLCFAVATAREFFGRETASAAFLYVTEEGAPAEMRKRMRRLVASGGDPLLPGRVIYRRGVRFDQPEAWGKVRDALASLDQPTLLVLDPLRDLLLGDENDSNIISAVARSIHAVLADFPEVTVVLLHHLSKRGEGDGGQRLRGSTALWGTADCTVIINADPIPTNLPEGTEVPLRGSFSVEPRNAQRGRFLWQWDAETGQMTEGGAEARTLTDRAAAHIAENGPATLAELAKALGTTVDSVGRSLRREREAGDDRFRVTSGAGPNDPSLWGLVE